MLIKHSVVFDYPNLNLTFHSLRCIILLNSRGGRRSGNMVWERLSSQAQVYFYWEYCANVDDGEQISFAEFDEMMTGYVF